MPLPALELPALSSLGSLLGGGSTTKVSQTATNNTSVNLSTILSNQSPGNASAPATGSASTSAASGTGSDNPPLSTSPFDFPYLGVSPGGENAVQAGASGGSGLGKANIGMIALAGLATVGALFLLKKKR